MDRLWSYPWNLPPAKSGRELELDDLVEAMEKQAASIGLEAAHYAEGQFELMRAYGLAGRLDDARMVLQRLLELNVPADAKARALIVTGCATERAQDFVSAVELYRKAVDLDPQSYFGHNNLAYSLSKLDRHGEAELEARAAIAVAPKVFHAHKNLGVACEGMGRFAEAARAYLAAVRAEPLERRAYRHLEEMVARNPELLREVEGLAEQIERYRRPNLKVQLEG